MITTPVLFPSGAHVSVRISVEGGRCLITDDGAAYAEADMMGALPIFRRAANTVASEVGVRFNHFEIFEAEARPETAAGWVAIVADASRRAVAITAERLAKKLDAEMRVSIVDRLTDVFGVKNVFAEAAISGASTHAWKVDALVRTDHREIAIEVITPAPASVSSAYVKLDDIRRLDNAPRTVAALSSRSSFGSDQLLILNRAAKIIDLKADLSELRRLAA
ncbi:hypothetical protein [Aurantimonas endophytica]|uniref:DUF1828 domain-containing protein n=1 Tax=Aurantimonas endophytica TaxID=1522175 RepID=A0A7W6MQX6_9HYPH|nr:hypothetical protein [Aurantimonas endophytica]MBB4004445.1 hypothetical protein [Aurantimonas endophytica]MCO6405282.1 hypothetical protein [Aurantimonas endophytica]